MRLRNTHRTQQPVPALGVGKPGCPRGSAGRRPWAGPWPSVSVSSSKWGLCSLAEGRIEVGVALVL